MVLTASAKRPYVPVALLSAVCASTPLRYGVHHGSQADELVADDLVIFVEREFGHVALGQFKIARALFVGAVHRAGHAAQALAQIFKAGADGQPVFGECGLGAAVYDLQEQLAHGHVDGIANQVGIQGFKNGLAGQNLGGHGGRMRHSGAADGLNQRFLDDALLYVQRQLAGPLLGSAPAHSVGQARHVGYFFDLGPTAFLWNRCRAMIGPLGNYAHLFNFVCMHRELRSFVWLG